MRDTVVLIEQFRLGPMAANHPTPWKIEIIAGILEKNESPNELAFRETTEETGGSLSEVVRV
ncbi:MAG: NUDIX domain-containing protein [Alphaproteobacteria bacterium]